MLGSQLKQLAKVADIARLDLAPGPLTIAPTNDGVTAWYSGMYAACGVTVEGDPLKAAMTPVSIGAADFQALAGLFDDADDVALMPMKSELRLSSQRRNVSLRYLDKPSLEGYDTLMAVKPIARCARDVFAREVGYAAQMASTNLTNPILTGVRLTGSGSAIGVQAANGVSLVFESSLPATNLGDRWAIVVPAVDFPLGLRILTGTDIELGAIADAHGVVRTIVVRGENGVIKLPCLAGTWPKLDAMRKAEYVDSLTISADAIKTLALAARTYRTANEAFLRPVEGGIMLETKAAEEGQYQEFIPGVVTQTYVLDVTNLESASKIASDAVAMQLANNLALATAGPRRLFIGLRVAK